ncbi:single-stranded DNA-binding protein (plasmid) [Streptomyces sp. L7]
MTFSGSYRITEYKGEQGTRVQHEVRAEEIGVSLRGQSVTVQRASQPADSGDETPF